MRSEASMKFITREDPTSFFNLNKKASELLLSGKLHKVSPYCCKYLKKEPMASYQKQTGRHPIIGITSDEGQMRKAKYTSCFTKDKKFVPMHDLSKELEEAIYKKYNIEVPEIYEYIDRTGCMGCPYGSWKGKTEKELLLVSPAQYKFLWDYFKESYEVLGIKRLTEEMRQENKEVLKMKQLNLFDFCFD